MKRIISLIVAAAMIFSMLAVNLPTIGEGSSKDPVQFALQHVEASPGDDVTVNFTVTGEFEANTLHAYVYFDKDALSIVGKLTKGEVWMDMLMNGGTVVDTGTQKPGELGIMAIMPQDPFTANGIIYTVKFHVAETVAPGTTLDLRLEIREFSNYPLEGEETPIENTAESGSISVIAGNKTVTFMVDGEQYAVFTGRPGETIVLPEEPIKEGYSFGGWTGLPEDRLVPDEDVVVEAAWIANDYTITYNVNGEFYAAQTYHYGDVVTAPEYSVPTGYTFSGWDIPATMPAENLVLNATLTQNDYTITYNVNGEFYATQTYHYGEVVTAPAYEVPTGYTFSGWDIPATMPAEDLVLNATLTQNDYTITYNVNGEFYATQTYHYGDVVTAPEYSVPTGYTFSGWEVPATMPAENLVVNATLTQNDYTITYNVNGEFYATQTYHYGDVVTAPTYEVPTGYTFSGWEVPATMPAENIVVNATLTQNDYTITYNVNGEFYATQTYHYGDVVTAPEYSVPTGYTFSGWDIPATMPAENLVLNATLIENDKYTVTFIVDGSEYSAFTGYAGDSIVLPTAPEKIGHTFNGWSGLPQDGLVPGENITVTARWIVNSYTITYNVNGELFETRTYLFGGEVTAPEYSVPNGYTFSGWDVPSTMPAEDLVLNATLTQNDYTITYNVNGEFYATQTYHYGDVVTAPEYSVLTGYTFSGWEVPATMPAENIVVNATLTQNDYTITYNVNGEFYATQTYNYGDVVTAPAYEVPTGYTFSGWDVPATMPAENLVVNATLTQNDYTITYNVNGEFYATQTYHYGDVVTAPTYEVPTGYSFSGWDVPATMPAENIVVNATLTQNDYTITYNVNGEFYATQTYHYGDVVTAPEYSVPTGYTFSGWEVPATMPAENLVLNAALTQNDYTITYNVNGEFYATQTYHYGNVVTAPTYEVPTGYSFSGWEVPATMPAENLVLNATLTINTYTVTFVDWDGELLSTQTVEHGSGAVAPDDPEREGYVFIGWDIEFDNVTSDLVITAMYEEAVLIGDVDGDGQISTADALIILRMAMGIHPVENLELADYDCDGIITTMDALCVLRLAMGIIG